MVIIFFAAADAADTADAADAADADAADAAADAEAADDTDATSEEEEAAAAAEEEEDGPTHQPAVKILQLVQPPAVLTVHLKRFAVTGRSTKKLDSAVPFTLELELHPFCGGAEAPRSFADLHAVPPLEASRYRLYAVVEHAGSFHGGHYTAYVRDADLDADEGPDEWNHFSDTHVRRATEAEVLGAQAFLLFYARC